MYAASFSVDRWLYSISSVMCHHSLNQGQFSVKMQIKTDWRSSKHGTHAVFLQKLSPLNEKVSTSTFVFVSFKSLKLICRSTGQPFASSSFSSLSSIVENCGTFRLSTLLLLNHYFQPRKINYIKTYPGITGVCGVLETLQVQN